VELVAGEDGVVTVPIAQQPDVSWQAKTPGYVMAPIHQNQPLGQAIISSKNQVLKSVSLLAGAEIPRAGFVKRTFHALVLLAISQGRRLIYATLLIAIMVGLLLYAKQRRPRRKSNRP
jgi:hypothetical protein